MKVLLITQARISSTRLPGKVMREINKEPLLKIHLNRLQKSKNVTKIIVATSNSEADNVIFDAVKNWGFEVYRGSENDVLDRYYHAAKKYKPNWVVRVTSDCPLIDPELLDKLVEFAEQNNVDYTANILLEHFPDGQDIEVFTFSALEKAWLECDNPRQREHVTLYIRENSNHIGKKLFSALNYPSEANYSEIRMTVDEKRDFELIKILINNLGTNASWLEYTNYILDNDLQSINGSIIRNEGSKQ